MSDAKPLIDMLHRMTSATGERWFAYRDALIAGIEQQAEELAAANAERDKATRRAESAEFDAAAMKDRLAAYHEVANKEVWYWQGKDDHIESIVCRIVIKPDQLRAILSDLAAANEAREKAERERDVARENARVRSGEALDYYSAMLNFAHEFGAKDGDNMIEVIGNGIDALRAEVERLREDAERYRWLANRVLACDYGDNDAQDRIGWRIRSDCVESKDGERSPVLMYGESIDAAIDAARKEA